MRTQQVFWTGAIVFLVVLLLALYGRVMETGRNLPDRRVIYTDTDIPAFAANTNIRQRKIITKLGKETQTQMSKTTSKLMKGPPKTMAVTSPTTTAKPNTKDRFRTLVDLITIMEEHNLLGNANEEERKIIMTKMLKVLSDKGRVDFASLEAILNGTLWNKPTPTVAEMTEKIEHLEQLGPFKPYILDKNYKSSTCPTSMTQKASRSPWFRARFVENMKLFLDKREVFDPETYNMLQRDPTPFGTGGLDIEGLKETLQNPNLTYPEPLSGPRQDCVTCAVVGTGGNLKSAGKGAEIDSHDYVFRVNVALTGKQYVNDVGNKSSFYGFFPESVVNRINFGRDNKFDDETKMMMMIFKSFDAEWLGDVLKGWHPNDFCYENIKPGMCWSMPAPKYKQGNMMIVHPHFFRYVHERFLNSTSSRPTTGTMVILMAIHLCDQVDMYGFGFDPRFPLHYYDGQKVEDAMNEPSSHSYPNEKILWRKLHSEGLVNWKLRPGT
ncbi:CMP-N-acetylneuraminate-beta-galactosamide-alpha-2,3-sialyltransferase 1-like [Branchiostoma floridae]|uniref:alpha-N-acetylgalactosaminide alpha-2,6-sialyltransferase n=1 Tax=Branchiostoma floridae TaxID=7739 RepID=A0A9J7NBS9_BRAFL|nr:CMP-N-acetylneuraminate-beta-galactosamide-alpha-2,3-sialyltransferase 1-like [Branchiostoma floridae]